MTDNYKAWKDMFTTSQKFMNDWVETFTKTGNQVSEEEEKKDFDFTNFQDVMSFQKRMFEDWQKMFGYMNPQNYYKQNPYDVWLNMMNMYNPFEASKFMPEFNLEVFEKMMNSQKLYLGAYEGWKNFNKNVIKPGNKLYKENVDKMVEQFNKIFLNNLLPLMPKEIQGLMTDTQSYFNTYFKSLENFLGPWSSAYQNIADITMESIFDDPMKLSDTLIQWKKAYDQTFGILVKSPVVGSAREMLEQNNKAIDAMIEMLVSVSEFMTKSSTVGYKYSKDAFADYIKSLEKGEGVKTFKEFYDMWSKHVENAMETYFYTDEFSKLIAKTADSAMIFKIEYNKLVEKALADLPIVTISQVDNVYKKVYDIRRELRNLQKEMEDLKNSTNNKQETNK
ncbi:poly(R)-hydroxyalkanoic acid synthase subunit PhaE [uncultured Anaerococcus sp.]|uniref:poly(R)-hydroxyalkanoic acid synthase subunit PhaE n=1 Tax=uncultured Anaerococcus sp. TaxID=293428 RepID=UPI0026068BC0|nr:poly(R)-hydroxyalkanoic acid synthase subunit PhaE [uncultured Anaerococcus sp.]